MNTSQKINFNAFRYRLYVSLDQSEKLKELNAESEALYQMLMDEHRFRYNTTASVVTKYLVYASEEKIKEEKIAKENAARSLILKKREFNLLIGILLIAILSVVTGILLFRQRMKNKQSKAQIEKELLLLKEEKLKRQIEMQSRSLTDFAIEIKLKRKLYKESIDNLKEILHEEENNLVEGIHSMISKMKQNDISDKPLSENDHETEVLLQRFKNQLLMRFPQLTKAEIELCSLIRLQLSNKEIAMYRGINQDSVKVAKRRLKKKLNIGISQSLTTYIIALNGEV